MPTGQPFTETDRDAICEMVSNGVSLSTAAEQVGFSLRTVRRHLQGDDEFRQMLLEAEQIATGRVEDVLYEAATKHKEAWAVKMWLTNRSEQGRWVDERDRGAGRGGGEITGGAVIVAVREVLTGSQDTTVATDALMSVPLPAIEVASREAS